MEPKADDFRRAILHDPYEPDLRRVFADWYEERGDVVSACTQRLLAEVMENCRVVRVVAWSERDACAWQENHVYPWMGQAQYAGTDGALLGLGANHAAVLFLPHWWLGPISTEVVRSIRCRIYCMCHDCLRQPGFGVGHSVNRLFTEPRSRAAPRRGP
jgi:uncharacterized protein (TIGR02996 family)